MTSLFFTRSAAKLLTKEGAADCCKHRPLTSLGAALFFGLEFLLTGLDTSNHAPWGATGHIPTIATICATPIRAATTPLRESRKNTNHKADCSSYLEAHASCASPLSYESFGDMRPVPSCRKKHKQDCEHEPRARAHKSVLHTHGMTSNRRFRMTFFAWLELSAGAGVASGCPGASV